jgi:hypothetical protein
MSIPDGIMMGFVIDPMTSKEHPLAVTGSPIELVQVVKILGLRPNEDQLDELIEGQNRNQPLAFSDDRGSFVTMQPVHAARDFLVKVAGFDPDDF